MTVCPSCGRENADDARFCSECGARLEPEATSREERKVVTCLFCDLVGFTARAESMDPEDVRRLLQPYHTRLRSELERHGGTVEKFIGDAVMAVFGAPISHEDDPERAVRAALAIRDTIADEGELEIRIGITTGEALIALGARPEAGEGMASGDVVNSAARIEAAAPAGTILVDETTYRATERAIAYRAGESVIAKGKTSPIPVWEALDARARVGVERVGGATLVGREQELTLLRQTLARVIREGEPQLLTLVGVPGIGKSRLVFELFRTIESGDFGIVLWRRGGSLPYGDGVTFWALSEMIKAQAGILESDSSDQAGTKLHEAVERYVTDPTEASWVERHLRPLAGLEAEEPSVGDRRSEAFAAWRRFFEALAETRPLVLVFEDLHWADEALLDFVDHLVVRARGVPVLAVCTARPELLERRSGWGGGKVNSSTILLSPLSSDETTALVLALLERPAISADVQTELLERAGGNPLYAEEFTRMLTERPGEVVLPETVQGIIAARLDTLPRAEKELLQDAAVMGKNFWLGSLGRQGWDVEEHLHSLEQKEFVSRQRRSAIAGESEYSFRHALVRDVAYDQIPKAERAEKHCAAAEWIDSLGRTEDNAEMLAHHYAAALDYARAAGQATGLFAERAYAALREAGDRALALNAFPQAIRFYERALELQAESERGELLLRYGRALQLAADDRCIDVLERAADALLSDGNSETAAEAYALLTEALHAHGRREQALEQLGRAVELVHDTPVSAAKATVLMQSARILAIGEQSTEALPIAREAIEMAKALDLTELAARGLNIHGLARSYTGDHEGGIADMRRSVELALSVSSPEAARAHHNLASIVWFVGDTAGAANLCEEGIRIGERLGAASIYNASRCLLCWQRFFTRAWDEANERAEAIIAECEAGTQNYFEYLPRLVRARIRLARGMSAELVSEDLRRAIEIARAMKDPQAILPTLSVATRVFVELGRIDQARAAAEELVALPPGEWSTPHLWRLLDLAWVGETLGVADELRRLHAAARADEVWPQVFGLVLDRDFERVAERLASMDYVDEPHARLEAAEVLLGVGRTLEAEAQLQRSVALYRSLGATRYINQAEALLAKAGLEIPA